jgi:hypothetical protein
MPILTETTHPRRRRLPVWALILAVVVLPLLGVFGWSLHRPVLIDDGLRQAAFGRFNIEPRGNSQPNTLHFGGGCLKMPGGRQTGWYVWYWFWP